MLGKVRRPNHLWRGRNADVGSDFVFTTQPADKDDQRSDELEGQFATFSPKYLKKRPEITHWILLLMSGYPAIVKALTSSWATRALASTQTRGVRCFRCCQRDRRVHDPQPEDKTTNAQRGYR